MYNPKIVAELQRMLKASETGDFTIFLNDRYLPEEDAEIIGLINKAISNYKSTTEYNMMKYQLANNALHIALWDMDVINGDPVNPGNTFTWSKEFRHLLGFSTEKDFPNVLSSWSERLHPDEAERVVNSLAAHLNDHSGRTPYDIEYRLRTKSEEYRYYHAFGETIRDNNGVPLRVAGALEDITEEKKIQEQLTTNDMRFNLLLKSINIALWDMIVDKNNPVDGDNEFWWSDKFRQLLGFTNEYDFPNILSSWSERLHPEDKERVLGLFAAHLNDRTGKTPYKVEYRVKKKNGAYIWLKADGATLRAADGTPIRVVGSVEDISKRLKRDELDDFINQFTNEMTCMTDSVTQILTIVEQLKSEQQQNLSASVASEKVASETKSITAVMQKIALQTNILAINAAIEAAHAGEFGKGFAIIAEEVSNLANQSKNLASQIEEKLKDMQQSSAVITNDMEKTVLLVDEQGKAATEVKVIVDTINTMYNELIQLIKHSINEN